MKVYGLWGIGRIGQSSRSPNSTQSIYIQPYDIKQLFSHSHSTQVDVLVTHDISTFDKPPNYINLTFTQRGMPEIRKALNSYSPRYYFLGHVGGPLLQYKDSNGYTEVCKLTDFEWTKRQPPNSSKFYGNFALEKFQRTFL